MQIYLTLLWQKHSWTRTSFMWCLLPPSLSDVLSDVSPEVTDADNQMKLTVTLNKITDFSECEHYKFTTQQNNVIKYWNLLHCLFDDNSYIKKIFFPLGLWIFVHSLIHISVNQRRQICSLYLLILLHSSCSWYLRYLLCFPCLLHSDRGSEVITHLRVDCVCLYNIHSFDGVWWWKSINMRLRICCLGIVWHVDYVWSGEIIIVFIIQSSFPQMVKPSGNKDNFYSCRKHFIRDSYSMYFFFFFKVTYKPASEVWKLYRSNKIRSFTVVWQFQQMSKCKQ